VADGFASTLLPETLVYGFAAGAIVPGEIAVGALLILGLFTRWALASGSLLMTALVFGTALRQKWGPLSTQLIYAAVYHGLHLFVGDNRFSLDAWLRGRRA
jgi:thiosulfate dehydrogenase [quinone] large subunit